MGLKKHNPGCNCCGVRILIWDLGIPVYSGFRPYSVSQLSHFNFQNATETTSALEELGDDVSVDYVTGQADPPDSFFDDEPLFDPNTYAVEQGYWSGNIGDYDLIIWPFPLSGERLDQTEGACAGESVSYSTAIDAGNHPLFGIPDWWQDVVDGNWSGRLLWTTAGNSINEQGPHGFGFSANVFLNSLSDTHGMTIDDGALSDPLDFSTVADAASSDLTEGITSLSMSTINTRLSGGELVFTDGSPSADLRIDPTWCFNVASGTFVQNYDICRRNRVDLPRGVVIGVPQKTVDFVILMGDHDFLFPHPLVGVPDDHKQFLHNCVEVPISED